MRRIISLLLVLALLGGAFVAWQWWEKRRVLDALTEVIQSNVLEGLLAEKTEELASGQADEINLAFTGLNLVQGDEGLEIWRLDAQWATLRQESGLIEAQEPKARYRVGDKEAEEYLYVEADSALVSENQTHLTLTGNVEAQYKEDVLHSPKAEFWNENRTLFFPSGLELSGPKLSGTAAYAEWDLENNVLDASGGVDLIWVMPEPEQAVNPEAETEDGTEADASVASGVQSLSQPE